MSRSLRAWRKVHRWTFGYWRWPGLVSVSVMTIISLTGILLVHQDDLAFMQRSRISTRILPGTYEARLDQTREGQGTSALLAKEASVPTRWVVLDLHTGDFFGKLGPLAYDLIALMFMILSATGIVMFFRIKNAQMQRGE